MKKITLLSCVLGLSLTIGAQTKLTFETDAIGTTTNAAALWGGGSVDVLANPYATGINTSAKVLHVKNDNYCVVFLNLPIPAGTKTAYPYLTLKYKLCYVGPNGGTDLNYPNTDFYSLPSSSTGYSAANTSPDVMRFGSSIGWSGVSWGSATVGTWVQCGFTFASSTLTNIPAGFIAIKIAKSKLEYLIDDIELIPAVDPNNVMINNFESDAIGTTYVTTGATGATATVTADPANSGNSLKIVTDGTNYDQFVNINVTLPSGKVLSNYDRLYLDKFVDATSSVYKNFSIKVGTTTIYTETSYPSQGTNSVWQNKDYDLTGVDLSAVGNSFTLTLGISGPSLSYYIDNIKLHLKDIGTGLNKENVSPLIVFCTGNAIQMNKQVSQVEVFDINGRLLLNKSNTSSLNVAVLKKGIYIVKSNFEGNIYTSKITL